MKLFCLFFFILFSGHCDLKVYISQVSHNTSSFLKLLKTLSHDQSANCKRQGCDFCIPLPILPLSMNLILTQKDSTISFRFEPVCASKPTLSMLLGSILFHFICVCVYVCVCVVEHSDHNLQNTFKIHSQDSWRTRHICTFAIDIFSKQQSVEQQ